jgi:hypothetical protein
LNLEEQEKRLVMQQLEIFRSESEVDCPPAKAGRPQVGEIQGRQGERRLENAVCSLYQQTVAKRTGRV